MDINKSMGQPSFCIGATATHAITTCTFPKSSQAAGTCIYITKICYSASAAPAATVEATLTGAQTPAQAAQTLKFEIPAAAFAPVTIDFGVHPLKCTVNTDAVLTIPDLGAAVIGSAQIFGYYGPI